MTGIGIFFLYFLDMLFSFFLIFYMKNISDKSRSLDFRNLVFAMIIDSFVKRFIHVFPVIKKCILDFGCWILNKRLYSTFKIQHSKLCFYKSVFTLTLNSEVTKIVIIP